MPRGVATPPELRAKARSLLLAGHRQSEVCELTGLRKDTVSRLATEVGDQLRQVAKKKQESDADLIMAYFRSALRALRVQADVLGDPEYCRGQRASDLGIAHGILGDKLAGIAATAQALGLVGVAAGTFTDRQLPEPNRDLPDSDAGSEPYRNGAVDSPG